VEEASYDCPHCGEQIVVPVEAQAGLEQEYVEDCPVCCSPVVLSVRIEPDGAVSLTAREE
jgi:DNA-directed RNA polymerase subunit RPC12/RpoP